MQNSQAYDIPREADADLIALCDESMRQTLSAPGIYLLSSVIVLATELASVREQMAGLRMRGQRKKLHWRDESAERRSLVARGLAGLHTDIVIATQCGMDRSKQERARRMALQTLLMDLAGRAVRQAVFESRGPARDRADVAALAGLRSSGVLPPTLRVSHTPGDEDYALWSADIAAGAYSAALGGTPGPWATLLTGCKVTVLACGACGTPHAPEAYG